MTATPSPEPPTQYHDNALDRLLIGFFAQKMAQAVGKHTALSGYDGLIDLSRQVVRSYDAQGQQAVIGVMLRSIIPAPLLWSIRTLVRPRSFILEWNAWFAARMFAWLVGPCQQRAVDITTPQGQQRTQQSGIYIERCRYLEQSGCVGMCINMCKLPTQQFFAQEFGFPLTMTPNFEDFSCEMVFGQAAPPLKTEACYQQSCLQQACEIAAPLPGACPKLQDAET